MYLLKQFVGALTQPLIFALVLALIAAVLWLFRRRRLSATFLIGAGAVAYLASTLLIASALQRPLAGRYISPLDDPPRVSSVVVLGSYYGPRGDLPVTASLDADGLARIVEGVRLWRKLPGARLVVSGGAPSGPDNHPPAQGYARMAQALGVDAASIIVLDKALDTSSEARYITQLLHAEPFILVTSSNHMPRAMRLMERAGGHPIAAPATGRPGTFDWDWLLPSSAGLRGTEAALHEYLGLTAISLGLD